MTLNHGSFAHTDEHCIEMKKCLVIICFIIGIAIPAFGEPAKRIVSLAPNITEILYALNVEDRIVGVTNFCDFPEAAKTKPRIGGMSNPSLEAVLSLKPDLVMVTTDGNARQFEERLRSLKMKTYVFRARHIADFPSELRSMGSLLGVSKKAEILARELETALAKRKSELSREQSMIQKKILFVIWPDPLIVAGSNTVINDAITMLGYENSAHRATSAYPKYSLEAVLQEPPDMIVIGKGHPDMKKLSEGILQRLSFVPAAKNGAVCYVSDNLYRLGPRVINGIEELEACFK